ncbi:Similar to Eif2b5: Translation initiation factor eIF-2B subunit epsilon (Mus musculus) [Cotesia congregata]|uniref:Translation initiation factor eIF2B subunit epsilon n=1 Tax=Cotesia congregata TaxID=51543 RepID=A0A8J2HN58_COTCN|nr:Similar to Eif2b5: Translation initiation factor eIF-2B subunit epsilon (Mus musculus) [Cotesia congregata]
MLDNQQSVQAVVLADDFSTSLLTPLQHIFPSILTPVANLNLLDYIVYDDITVSLILSDGCRSLGDALRDIDTKGWIRGDFVLIRGDAFINTNLLTLLSKHKAKKDKDKGIAMSVVFRDIGSSRPTNLTSNTCFSVVNKLTDQLIFYKPSNLESHQKKLQFELSWFLDHEQIEINTGIIDTHVYMCSQTVLSLFSDNFDFQTMEDFIKGVLLNEEILDSRIYRLILEAGDYALPISSWAAYHTLTRDILQRQSYPLTPDMLAPFNNIVYSSKSTYKYKNSGLARGCILKNDSIVGSNSQLGNNTLVSRSTIGNNCKIGDNVVIDNSYILNNVTITDNCTIKNSFLFSNCNLSPKTLTDTCIISEGVKVPENNYSKCVLEGDKGKIKLVEMTDYLEEDKFVFFKKYTDLDDEDNDNDDNDDDDDSSVLEETSSKRSGQTPDDIPDDTHIFLTEVIDSLLRAYQDKLNCENIILEINSSRYAYNVGIREVTYNVIKGILLLPMHYLGEEKIPVDNANYQKTLKAMINYFTPIILNYVKTDDAQEDCLNAIEEIAGSNEFVMNFAQHLVHLLYDKDVLSEDKIIEWFNENDNDDGFYSEKIRKVLQPFIKWLNEAEEDSSDED